METTREDFTLTDRLMVLESIISTAEMRGETEEAEELRDWRNGLLKAYGLG